MIRREHDAELANRLSADPAIHAAISRHGAALDWSPAVEGCVIISNGEDAVQIYEQTAPRDWQVMTIFGPTCRGKRALETAAAMKEWMRPHADMVFGSIPLSLPHALWFYRKLGGVPVDYVESGGVRYVAQEGEALYHFRAMPEWGDN